MKTVYPPTNTVCGGIKMYVALECKKDNQITVCYLYVNPGILTYLHLLFTKIFTNNNYPFKGKPLNSNQTVKSTINKL